MTAPDLSTLLPRHLAERAVSSRAALEGERKLVTVLFADVVGSTQLASDLDPEDLVDLLNGLFARWVAAVHRYEGTVDKFLGDGMLALFGAPLVHEDDPRRAVLAALEIRDATAAYAVDVGVPLEGRVGLNTGTVVVGTVGSDARMEYTAIGDAVNVAQRVEAAATPGAVFVSSGTAALVHAYFDLRAAGSFELKGKREPEPLHEVLAALEAGGSVHGVAGLSAPLVGRRRELERLTAAHEHLAHGRGSVLAIVGDAGLGKSRLLAEARRRMEGVRWVQGHAVSFGAATPFLPLTTVARDLGGSDGDLRALIDGELDPTDGGLRDRMMASIRRLVLDHAPLAVAIEDLHWADQATLDVLEVLSTAAGSHPILVIVTLRPEGLVGAAGLGAEVVELDPLDDRARTDLVGELLDSAEAPDALGRLVVERADGNPFFTEELLRSLIDAGALVREAGGWRVEPAMVPAEMPATVQGVVSARVDRLPEYAKRCLQAASVLGPVFDSTTLQAMLDESPPIDELVDAGFLVPTDAGHAFVHAITQDVAYGSSLKRHRRRLHARAAEIIEAAGAQEREARAAELGRHHDLAGNPEAAVPYLVLAARRSAAAYANQAALDLSQRVLELTEDEQLRFDMLLLHSRVLGFTGRHEEESEVVERLRELAGDDPRRDVLVDEAAIRAAFGSGYLEAAPLCEAALAKSEALGDDVVRGRILLQAALLQLRQYSPARAVAPLEEAIELFTSAGEGRHRAEALSRLAGALRLVDPERCAAVLEEALAAAEEVGDPQLISVATYRMGISDLGRGDPTAAADRFDQVIEAAAGIGDTRMLTEGHRLAAAARAHLGEAERADDHLLTAMRLARATGNSHGWLFSCMSLIEQWEAQERLADMLSLLTDLEPQVASWDEPANLSYIHYALGYRALRWLNRPDEAAARLEQALAVVGDSPEWMPPAVMYRNGLAMVRIDQGRLDEAATLLDEALTMATENQLLEVTGGYLAVTEARLGLATGDLAKATAAIERLLDLAGDGVDDVERHGARVLRARVALAAGRPEEALADLQAALDQEPLRSEGRWHSEVHVRALLLEAMAAAGRESDQELAAARAAAERYLASVPPDHREAVRRRPDVAAILDA